MNLSVSAFAFGLCLQCHPSHLTSDLFLFASFLKSMALCFWEDKNAMLKRTCNIPLHCSIWLYIWLFFKFFKLGGYNKLKWLVKIEISEIDPPPTITVWRVRYSGCYLWVIAQTPPTHSISVKGLTKRVEPDQHLNDSAPPEISGNEVEIPYW